MNLHTSASVNAFNVLGGRGFVANSTAVSNRPHSIPRSQATLSGWAKASCRCDFKLTQRLRQDGIWTPTLTVLPFWSRRFLFA